MEFSPRKFPFSEKIGKFLKLGKTLLSYDAYGRMSWARMDQNTWHFGYDNHHRLISINKDGVYFFTIYPLRLESLGHDIFILWFAKFAG